MKQTNIILQSSENHNTVSFFTSSSSFGFSNALAGISKLYSDILEEEITPRQTLHLLNAQIAFLGIVLPVGPLFVNAFAVAWFALALRGCKRAGL